MYLVPSNLCNWLSFFAGNCRKLTRCFPRSPANFKGRRKEEYGRERVTGGIITGDGEGTEKENEGDRHPARVT